MADAPQQGTPQADDPRVERAKILGGGEPGHESMVHAEQGAQLSDEEERSGLDWLLGDPTPTVHDVTVQFETAGGDVPLTFVLRQLDTRKIDEIEQKHVNRTTGSMDRLAADVEIVSEATIELRDKSGRGVALTSDEFRTYKQRNPLTQAMEPFTNASAAGALEHRFRKQLGLLGGVAVEIRRIAGVDPAKVGPAQRRLVEASGN